MTGVRNIEDFSYVAVLERMCSMKIGMLTSGGDCQSLNATMRGVAKTLYNNIKDVEIIGFIEGYKGLMYEDYKIMTPNDFRAFLQRAALYLEPPDSHLSL